MMDANATLIKMEGVKKVFLTDEVETHALEEIHLEIKKGTYISVNRRCFLFWDCWILRHTEIIG
jgi:hypothetical protein